MASAFKGLIIHNWDSPRNWPPFSMLLQDFTGTRAMKNYDRFSLLKFNGQYSFGLTTCDNKQAVIYLNKLLPNIQDSLGRSRKYILVQ